MKSRRPSGFTLIEVIVTLAVIAALITALAVSFIKQLDRLARLKEEGALKAMGQAFREGVRRNRYIPNETNWFSVVATQLGWQTNEVTTTARSLNRVFLIDPTLQVGVNTTGRPLENGYSQSIAGSVVTNLLGARVRPISPLFMIISTLSTPLPSTLVSGVGDSSGSNAFASLWNSPEGAVPPVWSWSSGEDLKIERIDLTDLFVPIVLANADVTGTPSYGIDSLTVATVSYTATVPPPAYFLRGSELKLYNTAGDLEYSEILYVAHDFTFELGAWAGKPYLGRSIGAPNGKDLQRAMDLFLKAPSNANAQGGATRQGVYNAMTAYMTAFIAWRAAGYPDEGCPGTVGNNTYTSAVSAARTTLSTVTSDFINP